MAAWAGSAVVLLHLLINVGHAAAHRSLGIAISAWQTSYVAAVIVLGPIAAATLLWTSRSRVGAWLLGVSMTGSLLFGTYYHYIAISADHVGHLPPGDRQALFRSTAFLLALSELVGVAVAAWALNRARPASERRPATHGHVS